MKGFAGLMEVLGMRVLIERRLYLLFDGIYLR